METVSDVVLIRVCSKIKEVLIVSCSVSLVIAQLDELLI